MDLKAINSTDSEIKAALENERSFFEKLETEFKNLLFGVIFALLKDDEANIWVTGVLAIIEFFQILIFPFHIQINAVWASGDITNGIERFLEFFQLVYYFKDTTWNLYLTVFYIVFGVVMLTVLDVLYVSYSFSKKKYALYWPLQVLRGVAWLFMSILFLPLLGYFFSVLGCITDNSGRLVHQIFTEIVCWEGIYVLHGALAIVGAVVFGLLTLTFSITYFECRSTSTDPTARANSRATFLLKAYQLIMIVCFTFMNGTQFDYVLLTLIVGGSIILFFKFHFNSTYYNEYIAILWSLLMSLNLWTALMLFFSKIMNETIKEGSAIAWLLGIPFIIVISLISRDHRVDHLLINVNKFQSGEQIMYQIRYILKLMSWQTSDRHALILLDGYLEIHKQTCNKEDCPLKQKVLKNNRLLKTLNKSDDLMAEKYGLLVQLLYQMYAQGIKKFPSDTALRISYSFFLLERMQSRQQALQELTLTEQCKPPFDEQFIIYRYKKIIEDEIAESQNEGQGGLDIISENAFNNHLRLCQANIEKSALLHMEFWSQLSEDNPDLAKLNEVGSKINNSVANVEEHWSKLYKINPNSPKALRAYGRFLIDIISDKEAGEDLLDRARMMMNTHAYRKAINLVNANANEDFSNDPTPTAFISGDSEKFGIITGVNLAAASLFGYNKTELLNRKVNMLMPQVYARSHDLFIEEYIANGDAKQQNSSREKFVLGKHKSNYIFPFYYSVKAISSMINGIQFVATFRLEKNLKNAAYVLTLPDGTIDSISSTCINVLKLDQKMIIQKKANITDFVPNIIKDRATIFTHGSANHKNSATVNFEYPRDSEYILNPNETAIDLHCSLTDLIFLAGRENAGMQFKFEMPPVKKHAAAAQHHLSFTRAAKLINFQFKFEKDRPVITGEYVEGTSSEVNSAQVEQDLNEDLLNSELRSNLGDNGLGASGFADSVKKKSEATSPEIQQPDPEVKKVDYGVGIKILRMVNGKPSEIDDRHGSEEDEEDENGEGSESSKQKAAEEKRKHDEHDDKDEDLTQKDFNTTFKSRRALNQVISDRRQPNSIRNLKWVANILVLCMFLLAAIDYVVTSVEFNEVRDNFDVITLSDLKIAELQSIVAACQSLVLMNIGISVSSTTEESAREAIDSSASAVKKIVDTLGLSSLGLSDQHRDLLQTNSITLQLLVGADQYSTTSYNLDQATLQVISRALNVLTTPLESLNVTNTDAYFVLYNNFNNFYVGLRQSSEYYVTELYDRYDIIEIAFLVLILVPGCLLIVALTVLIPVFYKVNRSREEVLSLFLDIPDKTVKALYAKCETFITNLQLGDEDDMISEVAEESFEKQNEQASESNEYHPRKKRKKFKNSGANQRRFIFQFFITACCMQSLFIANFFLSKGLLNKLSSITSEYNSTSTAESFYSFVFNTQRQVIIDNKFPILNGDGRQVAIDNINKLYDLDSSIHQEHSINVQIQAGRYVEAFNQIFMLNPCETLNASTAECNAFASGAVSQGMAVAITRHFENLRYMMGLYTNFTNDPNLSFPNRTSFNYTTIYRPTRYGSNTQKNNYLNIIKTTQATEADTSQKFYIKESFRYLMEEFKAGIDANYNTYKTVRIIILILFYIIVIGAYLMLWLPLLRKLSKDIWRTKCMLMMIPLNVVSRIKSIKFYLKRFWNERSIGND